MLTIGVDAHKRVHAAVAVDALGRAVAQWRGANTPDGWQALTRWAEALSEPLSAERTALGAERTMERQWGIEGAWQYGRGLAQQLVATGERVVDVNPRQTAAMRRGGRAVGKTDRLDAQAVARVVCQEAAALPRVPAEDGTAVLALWTQERDGLVAEETRLRNQVQQVLTQLDPTYQAQLPDLTSAAGIAALVGYTVADPDDILGQARAAAVRRAGERLALIRDQVTRVTGQLETAGRRHYAALDAIVGIGPLTAGQLAGYLGPGQRFATDAHLARYLGAAPIEASSGERVRHRLHRGGHRAGNAILERIALTQGRCHAPAQTYLARRQREGKTQREARRALKRYLARAIWRAWQQCAPLALDELADLVRPPTPADVAALT